MKQLTDEQREAVAAVIAAAVGRPRWFDFGLWVSGVLLGALASFFIARYFYRQTAEEPLEDDAEEG